MASATESPTIAARAAGERVPASSMVKAMELQNAVMHFRVGPGRLALPEWAAAEQYCRLRSGGRRWRRRHERRQGCRYRRLGLGRNFFVTHIDSPATGETLVYTVFPRGGSVVVTGCRRIYDW